MKIKSWPKLFFSIILTQSAGLIGTVFTFDAIPTWYATLIRPTFAPPNWIFGPVWTILYTLIGISLYLIWANKRGSLKLFLFHLFLNAIWSPIFFGARNLGLAFLVILIMDITLILIIRNFYKLNKVAGLILIPYLLWICFATLLNYSFWRLNPSIIYAQDDYTYAQDNYKNDLFDFKSKQASYQQNQTLLLKEELRLSLYKFVITRNKFIKSYLTAIRVRSREQVFSKVDPEIVWYTNSQKNYLTSDSLEELIRKSKDEDTRYESDTLPIVYFSLVNISLDQVKDLKNKHISLYNKLKKESEELIKLGRADDKLFNRWFNDIDQELNNISKIEDETNQHISKMFESDINEKKSLYNKSIETLSPASLSLLKLNKYVKELETVIESKR